MSNCDAIFRFIGELANMVQEYGYEPLSKDEFTEILKIIKVENDKGNYYSQPGNLVRGARDFWAKTDRPTVAKNIETVFPFAF
jgi:hypothetical protein